MIKKQAGPWTTKYLNKTLERFGGYEPGAGAWGEGNGHYDSLGWGSLLYRLEESDVAQISNMATSRASSIASSTLSSVASVLSSSSILTTMAPTHTVSGHRHHHHHHTSFSSTSTIAPQDVCHA